jgi:hypothetical protein
MRWKPALNAFAITFGDRFPAAETYSPNRRKHRLARQTLPGEQVRIFKPTGVGVGSCTAGRSWSELV